MDELDAPLVWRELWGIAGTTGNGNHWPGPVGGGKIAPPQDYTGKGPWRHEKEGERIAGDGPLPSRLTATSGRAAGPLDRGGGVTDGPGGQLHRAGGGKHPVALRLLRDFPVSRGGGRVRHSAAGRVAVLFSSSARGGAPPPPLCRRPILSDEGLRRPADWGTVRLCPLRQAGAGNGGSGLGPCWSTGVLPPASASPSLRLWGRRCNLSSYE